MHMLNIQIIANESHLPKFNSTLTKVTLCLTDIATCGLLFQH